MRVAKRVSGVTEPGTLRQHRGRASRIQGYAKEGKDHLHHRSLVNEPPPLNQSGGLRCLSHAAPNFEKSRRNGFLSLEQHV